MEAYSRYAEELSLDGGVVNLPKSPDVPFWLQCHDCQYRWRNESEPDDYIQGCPKCYGVAPSAGIVPFELKLTCSCSVCAGEDGSLVRTVPVTEVHHANKCYDVVNGNVVEGSCHPDAEPDMWHLVIPSELVNMKVDL